MISPLTDKAVEVGAKAIVAQALLDRFIARCEARSIAGNSSPYPSGTKLSSLPPSYKDDFLLDADAALAALSAEGLCVAPKRELAFVVEIAGRNEAAEGK